MENVQRKGARSTEMGWCAGKVLITKDLEKKKATSKRLGALSCREPGHLHLYCLHQGIFTPPGSHANIELLDAWRNQSTEAKHTWWRTEPAVTRAGGPMCLFATAASGRFIAEEGDCSTSPREYCTFLWSKQSDSAGLHNLSTLKEFLHQQTPPVCGTSQQQPALLLHKVPPAPVSLLITMD